MEEGNSMMELKDGENGRGGNCLCVCRFFLMVVMEIVGNLVYILGTAGVLEKYLART